MGGLSKGDRSGPRPKRLNKGSNSAKILLSLLDDGPQSKRGVNANTGISMVTLSSTLSALAGRELIEQVWHLTPLGRQVVLEYEEKMKAEQQRPKSKGRQLTTSE